MYLLLISFALLRVDPSPWSILIVLVFIEERRKSRKMPDFAAK
jgi:hypothetical protein